MIHRALALALALAVAAPTLPHGDVTPQVVDTAGLPELGGEWHAENPYRNDDEAKELAIEIGASGYNQNCARCHGLQGISGGLAPDLRELKPTARDDAWYVDRVRNGYIQNGIPKMPPFEHLLTQEAVWAIRTYLDKRHKELMAERAAKKTSQAPHNAKPELTLAAWSGVAVALKTQSPGVLRVAVYENFPPFSWKENNNPRGIDVEIARAIAHRLGMDMSLQWVVPDETVDDDLRGAVWKGQAYTGKKGDVMLHVPYDKRLEARNDLVVLYSPYYTEEVGFLMDTDIRANLRDLNDIKDLKIVVDLDTTPDFIVSSPSVGIPSANVSRFFGAKKAMRALKEGKANVMMGQRGEMLGLRKILGMSAKRYRYITFPLPRIPITSWRIGLAVRVNRRELGEAIAAEVAAMIESGEMREIYEKAGVPNPSI